jgi:hypothetical protein
MTHFSLTPQLIADLLVAAFFLIEALRPRRAAPHRTDRGTTVVFWGCYVITLLALNSAVPSAVMAAPPVAWIGVIAAAGGLARVAADRLSPVPAALPAREMRWHAGDLAHLVFWIGAAAASLNVIALLTVAVAMLAATGVTGRSSGSASAGR